jgi:hypothetical protein
LPSPTGTFRSRPQNPSDSGAELWVGKPEYAPGFDDYVIAYRMNKAGYRLQIKIFDLQGILLAEIFNDRLSGQSGDLRWNGCDRNGNRLPPGIYLFYAEYFHLSGEKRILKKAFLIRP